MTDQRSEEVEPTIPSADGDIAPVGPGEVATDHSTETDDAASGPSVAPADEQIASELGDLA